MPGTKTKEERLAELMDETRVRMDAQDTEIADLKKKAKTRAITTPPKDEKPKSEFSISRAIMAARTGDWAEAKVEREMVKEEQARRRERFKGGALQRIMNVSTDSQGGFSVPEATQAELIEMLKAESVVQSMGPKSLDGLTVSPLRINRQAGASTHNWTSESTAVSDSTPTLDQINLTPHKSMLVVKLTNEQLMLGQVGEQFVRQDMAEQLALGEDLGYISGSGASGQPLGMVGMTGIGTVAFGGGVDLDKLFEMLYELEKDNVPCSKLGWLLNPLVWHDLRVLKDGEGRYLLDPKTQTLLGFPYKKTTQMNTPTGSATSNALVLVDFAEIILASWGAMDILVSKEATDSSGNSAFMLDETWVRVVRHVDIAARHPEAICTSTGITT